MRKILLALLTGIIVISTLSFVAFSQVPGSGPPPGLMTAITAHTSLTTHSDSDCRSVKVTFYTHPLTDGPAAINYYLGGYEDGTFAILHCGFGPQLLEAFDGQGYPGPYTMRFSHWVVSNNYVKIGNLYNFNTTLTILKTCPGKCDTTVIAVFVPKTS